MIYRRLNVDTMLRSTPKLAGDELTLRDRRYLGVFSLAGLSLFAAMIHFALMCFSILSPYIFTKLLTPRTITQNINVWVPDLRGLDAMFPPAISETVLLSESCSLFRPRTMQNSSIIIVPKIFFFSEIDNRVSICFFFALSFAFQIYETVDSMGYVLDPSKWRLGYTLYANLAKGQVNKMHFIEYSFSATLMILVMVTQIGITDLSTIINVCINTWACMIIGLLAECILDAEKDSSELQGQTLWGYHLSFITHILGWVPLIPVLFTMVTPLTTYGICIKGTVNIPTAVLIFVVGEIILFCGFGLVQLVSIIKVLRIRGDEKIDKNDKNNAEINNACAVESYYILLSLFAKTFLALTIFIGIQMQP